VRPIGGGQGNRLAALDRRRYGGRNPARPRLAAARATGPLRSTGGDPAAMARHQGQSVFKRYSRPAKAIVS